MEKPPIRTACYIRVSTEGQTENYSAEEQQTRLAAYCAAKGWEVAGFYTDLGWSGGNTNRPALQRLLRDLREKQFQAVAVYKLDRLSRSQKDTLTLIEDEFLAHGVEFVSLSENFDTSTPFGRAMIGILSVFAQLEKEQITERFTMGRIGRCRAGYYHGGPTPPTGYQYIDGQLVPDPRKAYQIQEVFSRFLAGESMGTIHREMSRKYGGWGSASLVSRVLSNSVYIGKVKFAGQEFAGLHPPLITPETFAQAQTLLSVAKSNPAPSPKSPFRAGFLLSGMVRCERCGARYSGVHGYYKCYSRSKASAKYIVDPNCHNTNWPIPLLNDLIVQTVSRLSWDWEACTHQAEQTEEIPLQPALLTRLTSLENKGNRLLELYADGLLTRQQLEEKLAALEKERASLSHFHPVSVNSLDCSPVKPFPFLQWFDKAPLEKQRLLLGCLIHSIWIDGERVEIHWRI